MRTDFKARLSALAIAASWAASPAYAGTVAAPAAAEAPADPAPVAAADDGAEITVTARHTVERAQDVPVALSVVSGASLERTGGYTVADLQQRTPSLTAYNSNPRNSSLGIRGIGVSSASDGLDSSVGVYVDNVYFGRPGMALQDLIDVDRVEVLRGPQGTLFGRNTSAGVVNVTTRGPSFNWGAIGEVSGGNYGYHQERISITGPLVDGLLAFRLTGFDTGRNGIIDNLTTGKAGNSVNRQGGRAQLLFTPTDKLSIRTIADYSRERDTCCVSAIKTVLPASISSGTARTLSALATLGYTPTASTDSVVWDAPQQMRTKQWGASIQADWDLGFATATSVTAYRFWHFDALQESDSTPLNILDRNIAITDDRQVSQEFRLASDQTRRFSWQVGAYYFHQHLLDHYILNQFGNDASAFLTAYARTANPAAAAITVAPRSQYLDDVDTSVDSFATFGQANYKLTSTVTLTGGIRYTHDKRDGISVTSTTGTPYAATTIPFNYDVTVKGNNVSWLASISWKPASDLLAYASASTGYKGAGLNLNSATSAGTPLILKPEKVRSYEVGVKQQLFDRKLTLNIDGYWTLLNGLQANIYPLNGGKSFLTNVGNIRARGIEADAVWQATKELSFTVNGAFNDTRYSSYHNASCPVGGPAVCDLTGQRVYQSPKWVGNAIVDYRFDAGHGVTPYFIGRYSYRSNMFGTVDDGPYGRIPGYGLAAFRIGASFGGRYDASVWIENAFDKTYYENMSALAVVGANTYGYGGKIGTPRTIGGTLRVTL
ncbi:iron complex outermembrane receptor protein [Sphingomonas vulcanisoli]|uniref:Iron complex outermembrane receptor protein n=1 Tax=Sphingomonas vulcanisoli TaxID=1658060 RepID=A0ABX0TT02_9SPHN|nr:TonB-dependent receptor [Sphingomonas vulcanisoli]NIJ06746.1 iron complex outermembrane receptor protein [Sphingomonas vulcanisoli]